MTKFEEKLEKLPIKNIEHPVGNTKYYEAVYVKSLIAQVDEEFQELLDKYSNINDNYEKEVIRSSKLESQIVNLKSQLQQQALPVVPECVAEFIESYKDRRTIYGVFDKISKKRKTYPKLYEWVFEDENSQATFALAFITGKYQVEKPQLFYLKNKLTTSYLILDTSTGYFEHWGSTEATGRYKSSFTQQEIDSMETGSYEQIEVTE
ncbi:DUF1642 domain-containing protein [Lactococcus petauri]|uniref:DUF1642 domain-containing protein n=1 Tax=Lactococcus petauri TaxID=1940789 RepID=UPI003854A5C3